MNEYTQIGRLGKSHGVAGDLKLVVDDAYFELVFSLPMLFIKQGNSYLPYFIESIEEGSRLLIKFEDVDTPEQAKSLAGSHLFAQQSDIPASIQEAAITPENLEYAYLVGYQIMDTEQNNIAVIDDVLAYPQQELAQLNYEGKQRLVPLHADLIVSVDESTKTIVMDLPEGLLE